MSQVCDRLSRCLSRLAIAAMVTLVTGCGAFITMAANQHSSDGQNDTEDFKPESDRFLVETADRFGVMALFADAVYRRDLSLKARDSDGCAYLDATATNAPVPTYGMPKGRAGSWMRWVPDEPRNDEVVPCLNDKSGLYYETYVYKGKTGRFEEAVIAFRGTENREGQTVSDWRSNLANAFGFEPAQYAVARERMVPLIKELARIVVSPDGVPAKIYVTGHSLGGGLAQQAGYLSKSVKEVFTFNTTPVTNWSQLRLMNKVQNAWPIIHRVYNGGEILEDVRFVATAVTPARFGRHDLGLQFTRRSPIGGHSMQIIACAFAELIATQSGPADAEHGYPVDYIRNTLLNEALPDQPCSKAMAET